MDIQKRICKFCLAKCELFKFVEGNTKNFVDIVLTKVEFTVIQEPVLCKNCEEKLMNCFDFKATCLYTYDYLVPFINDKDSVKLDLKDIYVGKHGAGTVVSDDQHVCGFCMSLVKYCYAVSLDVKEGSIVLKKMIDQCLPELDLNIIKKPVICADCHRSLENYFCFVTNCLTAEEKIKKYCEGLGINSKSQIDLSDLLNSANASGMVGNSIDIVEPEKQIHVKIEYPEEIGCKSGVIKLEQMLCDDVKNARNTENKDESFITLYPNVANEQETPKNMSAPAEENNILDIIKTEKTSCGENETKPEDANCVEMDEQLKLNEDVEVKTDEHKVFRFEEIVVMSQPTTPDNLNEKQKQPIKKGIPKRIYQCECGSFQTTNKKDLKKHLRTHEASSEVTMYKCESCPFQAKFKYLVKNHMVEHKDPSEVTMIKCDFCSFQTKNNIYLQKHLLTHKVPSGVTHYKCDYCPYNTRDKYWFRNHMLKHPTKATYKCESCSYETKVRSNFKNHLLIHKAPSEVTMYKCNQCSYQSKRKNNLKVHSLLHADPTKTVYKCDTCPYQTIYKSNLSGHMEVHKDPSKIELFKCPSCSFSTARKCYLKDHLLRHKHLSEPKQFKCDFCPYQTTRKRYLKSHMLRPQNPSEMFECDSCSFQTSRKCQFKEHLLVHKHTPKEDMYTCDSCPYQTNPCQKCLVEPYKKKYTWIYNS